MGDVLEPYRVLVRAIQVAPIVCSFMRPHQLVVSTQTGPVLPNAGNSFWVTHATGKWSIFTWSPVGYAIAEEAEFPRFCQICAMMGPSAMYVVPDELIEKFGLRQLSDAEAERVFDAMDDGEWPSRE